MKRTAKYQAALRIAKQVLKQSHINTRNPENDVIYRALEVHGYFWDSEAGEWSNQRKSTSMFEGDDSLPTGVVRVRLMAHPGDMDQFIEIEKEALDTYGCQIVDVSAPYPNRKGAGVRVYITAKLPKKKNDSDEE